MITIDDRQNPIHAARASLLEELAGRLDIATSRAQRAVSCLGGLRPYVETSLTRELRVQARSASDRASEGVDLVRFLRQAPASSEQIPTGLAELRDLLPPAAAAFQALHEALAAKRDEIERDPRAWTKALELLDEAARHAAEAHGLLRGTSSAIENVVASVPDVLPAPVTPPSPPKGRKAAAAA